MHNVRHDLITIVSGLLQVSVHWVVRGPLPNQCSCRRWPHRSAAEGTAPAGRRTHCHTWQVCYPSVCPCIQLCLSTL